MKMRTKKERIIQLENELLHLEKKVKELEGRTDLIVHTPQGLLSFDFEPVNNIVRLLLDHLKLEVVKPPTKVSPVPPELKLRRKK